jgi:hypothetical protein
VELWKNSDSEPHPRVRDISGRVERVRAEIAN